VSERMPLGRNVWNSLRCSLWVWCGPTVSRLTNFGFPLLSLPTSPGGVDLGTLGCGPFALETAKPSDG
jgi:hypothetical protein